MYYTNEHLTHPLELRIGRLEGLLEEALAVLQAKARPSDGCMMNILIDDIILALANEPYEDE